MAATFPRTVTMKGGRVGAEGHGGSEYAVVGEDGVLHLPGHIAAEWPPGTLVPSGPGATCIATGEGLLLPILVQPENRKAMGWEDFLRGARLGPGARVTSLAA